jgi:hypothetical protein
MTMTFANLKILSRFNLHDTVVNNVFNPENICGAGFQEAS